MGLERSSLSMMGEDDPFDRDTRGALDLERELVVRLRNGDPQAMAAIITQYATPLIRFACHMLGSRDTAEDVVQYVFIHVWNRRAALDPNSKLKPYLFRAVRNRALNERATEITRIRYKSDVLAESVAGTILSAVPSSEDSILTRAAIQAAIGRLSERRRLAVRLRMEEEMSHAEIAEILGISPMAARRLVARALMDLRLALQMD